jgi:hypothetical protein
VKALIGWFTPPRRKAIYGLVAAGSVALVAFGLVTQEQIDSAVQTAGSVITALVTLMAFVNTGTDQ